MPNSSDVSVRPGGIIPDAVISGLTPNPRELTVVIHGLVLVVFKSRSSVTLLLPKEGVTGRTHKSVGLAYSSPSRSRPIDFSGCHWSFGSGSSGKAVKTVTRHSTEHPLTPIERLLDMAAVVGAARLKPLRSLVRDGLLEASFFLTDVQVSAHVPYAPCGWHILWRSGDIEMLCTDTALLRLHTSSAVRLRGKRYDGSADQVREIAKNERLLFIGNMDVDVKGDAKIAAANDQSLPTFELSETAGYVRLYERSESLKPRIPQASRSYLGRRFDRSTPLTDEDRTQFAPLSSPTSPECNLAADYYVSWESYL